MNSRGGGFDQYLLSRADVEKLISDSISTSKDLDINNDAAPYCLCSLHNEIALEHYDGKRSCGAVKTSFALSYNGDMKVAQEIMKYLETYLQIILLL